MVADRRVARRVFGAIDDVDFPLPHHGGRIEGRVSFPTQRTVVHRRPYRGCTTRRDHWVDASRLDEWSEHPWRALRARTRQRNTTGDREPNELDYTTTKRCHPPKMRLFNGKARASPRPLDEDLHQVQ